jgi:ADP-dependent NAD(P)H-hydrate dehydratase / NAD(P)H-hydrate epimerase
LTNNSSITAEWAARFSTLLGDEPEDSAVTIADAVELLTPEEMAEADRQTIAAGTAGIALMERAGIAVAEFARRRVPPGSEITVLAGPGNNGGDGFVAASSLADAGYLVTVGLLSERSALSGDAALAANGWMGPVETLRPDLFQGAGLIVDALFGAGLDRPIEGPAAEAIVAANESGIPILAVDLPSGIDGRNGQVLGTAIRAEETVTFFRLKPGHLLMPGRMHAGRTSVVDIGIGAGTLESIAPKAFHNIPRLWTGQLQWPRMDGHKYDRGHAVVVSGPMTRTGAARLAARGALRAGAGLVSVASPRDALPIHAAQLTAIMILPMDGSVDLVDILADERRNAVVLGPALGVGDMTKALVEAALGMRPAAVLDADALTSFAGKAERLFELIKGRSDATVLTPHDGEFARLFPDLAETPSKLDRVREAAVRSGAVVVAKGADTVIASPDGRAAIADNGPPDLATAGSGDVLAGMIAGLLAQRMPPFEAAAAAVWMHGAAARRVGRGLIA